MNKVYSLLFFSFYLILSIISTPVSGQSAGYHYVPVANKHIGIWPDLDAWNNNKFKWLYDKWGFTKVLILSSSPGIDNSAQYNNATAAGFNKSDLLMTISRSNYQYAVDNFDCGSYYIGEAVEHDCYGDPTVGDQVYSAGELTQISEYIKSKRPDSKLVIDGYKRCSHLIIAGGIADKIMYSSYVNWNEVKTIGPICHVNLGWGDEYEYPWMEGSSNQSDSWRDMKQKFGDKFSMSWMNAKGDEYSTLFQTANEIGLKTIWLYAFDGIDSAKIETFCDAAVNAGWLYKVEDSKGPTISGAIIYKGNAEYGLSNCTVNLIPIGLTDTISVNTDSYGHFILENVENGEYNISFNYNAQWRSANSTDALMVLRYFAGLENLDELQKLSADVNNNGVINSTDALIIVQRFVGIFNEFPNNKPDWIFLPPQNPYIINQSNQQIIIYCLETGDVNGSLPP